MSITVHMPNEKLAKAFLAAKPDNVDAKGVTVKVDTKDLPQTPTEAEALYKAAGKVLSKPKNVTVKVAKKGKRLGVMSITKQENVQLGLLLKYLYTDNRLNELPGEVLRFPEALDKLAGRYST